ncbi:type IA DNA topoisomerase [Weeksella virosa]|uniref:DNA topoisomerase n=1 Tax=Weeksella virosa (strain ATCC 43766 / DSM 16922 / JCM 21250 / CCUG 30538 / CDC 9751 / IAM 14551 / NBRC 16016 / NCTC 11634 / CL345/78) TaxID=865938 RepID=F0NY43_WEEVC|nr:type IA DNA topoisomerase [Weeksella virosa]ADX67034.1 DNA topoisomerase III [Weeksella virosa DSM 16922]SUP53300.1 DNA topoisomerase 3 [Weeksella virosa]VEH63236.1 DNA topoisomerase 3 [Weeksella virosa]
MKVCIAEKPSVAKDIAQVLGANQRKDGYYEGNGYQVTWTFGHLCTLKEPHDYTPTWRSWDLNHLPIIPPSFGIKLIHNKGVEKQFRIIERLVQQSTEVINCGDAGQEGELIQRWVLQKAKNNAPLKRLWISSLTEEAIQEGFENLKDGNLYNNLYAAGSARAIGDWLLGINATRAFTKKYAPFGTVLSIGRVQTPTLAMIVERQKEIDSFVIEEYWELKTLYKETEFIATIDRLKTKEKAEKGLEYLKQFPLEIIAFETKEGKEKPPRLFDLTSLQVEANKKLAYSAENTLKYVQSLYEKKMVTYPRVDTTYLSEDLHPKIEGILQKLTPYATYTASLLEKPIAKSKNIFDNSKVTDHHAIIPTGNFSSDLTIDEKKIYDMICRRFISVFYPDCLVSNTLVEAKIGDINFRTTGKQILDFGWRVLYPKDKKNQEEKEEEKTIPNFVVGEKGPHEPFIHQGKTTPPKPYTEATLLRAMETAGKQVDDEEMRDLLKENGIGRPSTRANIIETLFKRKYIEKKRKNIFATLTGIQLIDLIENNLLKSPELTGQWELKLRLIEKGEYSLEVFKEELIEMVKEVTNGVKFSIKKPIRVEPEEKTKPKREKKETQKIEELLCPKCQQHTLVKGKTAYGCRNFSDCGFVLPFEWCAKKLTNKQTVDLITKHKTAKIKGFIIDDVKVDGNLFLDENLAIQLKQS